MKIIVVLLILCIAGRSFASNVYIHGQWRNGPAFAVLNFCEDAATARFSRLTSKIDSLDNSFEFHLDLANPTILTIADQFVIVEPGDSVSVEVNQIGSAVSVNFLGNKSLLHNFLMKLWEQIKPFPVYKYSLTDSISLGKYKEAATNHFDSCLAFLTKYFETEDESSEKISRELLTTRFYNDLLYPITVGVSKEKLPIGYFDRIDAEFFKKENLVGFREFILLVLYYNTLCKSSIPRFSYDSAVAEAHIISAYKSFDGTVRDNLLLSIFTQLTERGSRQNQTQIDQLYKYLTAAFPHQNDRTKQISEFKRTFEIIERPLPSEILAQSVIDRNGHSISLNEVLSRDQVIYVDFWASWCGPCIQEMPTEKDLMSQMKGHKIKFVLISLDENKQKWLKAVARVNVDGEHYLISEGFKSAIVQYLAFNEIPRYVIFDRNGRLKSRNAPRPGYILKNKSVLLNLVD